MNVIKAMMLPLLALLLLARTGSVLAAEAVLLQEMVKQDDANLSRFVLRFDRMPGFRVETSGQKIDIILEEASLAANAPLPPSDERLVRILAGQTSDTLVLSLLLRRPPYFVNPVRDRLENRLTIDVHWRDDQSRSRPAIARALPGHVAISGDGSLSARSLESGYRGRWSDFFTAYERPLQLPAQLRYSWPPFPCLQYFRDVEPLLSGEVLDQAQQRNWPQALEACDRIDRQRLAPMQQIGLVLIRVELLLRADRHRQAANLLQQLRLQLQEETPRPADLQDCAELLELYLLAQRSEAPFELLAQLDLLTENNALPDVAEQLRLLQIEAFLVAGNAELAASLAEEALQGDPGPLQGRLQQRLADAWFLQGRLEMATDLYQELGQQIDDAPFSLAGYSLGLYRQRRFDEALLALRRLLEQSSGSDLRDQARYAIALALLHRGEANSALAQLHQIFPGNEGGLLARAKIADLSVAGGDARSRAQALEDYALLEERFSDRAARAEMQFKQALVLFLLERRAEAVEQLRQFLTSDRLTDLRPHALALLAELLPGLIDQYVQEERYFDALVLVEQNREILVASQRNYDFLLQLGTVFSRLQFAERALRLYQYLLDATADADRRAAIYPPLLQALAALQQHQQVIDYARRYQQEYPAGTQQDQVLLALVHALLARGDTAAADQILHDRQRPFGVALEQLAARRAEQRGALAVARRHLDQLEAQAPQAMTAEDRFLLADLCARLGDLVRASALYRQTAKNPGLRLASLYRLGELALQQGQRQEGLRFLRQVAETEEPSAWKDLAREALRMAGFRPL